ncbi:MAG: GTP-binding protein [Nanoarchaeota archaeon]|nr:GTP-binding protein [Nanoarchaeota archaeon]MBU1849255.1 GTP-binding protein [Nanoarchaeota archaeon]
MTETMKFVIVGHIDHGKSTLIGRLFYDTNSLPEGKIEELKTVCEALGKELEFGFLMDHLEEERDQGITIDTAQTFFRTKNREYNIIDAPGHVEFIKNMITGASQAEAAILIVDAEEGVQEQTRRHAYILNMLGLSQVIVVINKMDKVEYKKERFEEVKKELLEFLLKINIQPSYIIPISAKNGDFVAKKSNTLPWYQGPTVLDALDSFKIKESEKNKELRFPVQDVYKWDKRIIAGKIVSGTIKKKDKIVVLPSEEETIVESIEEFGKENIEFAEAGKSTGITTKDKLFIDRGAVIIRKNEEKPLITNKVEAHLFWMDKNPYKKGERLLFKCATQEVMCEIETIKKVVDSSTLQTIKENAEEIKNREVGDIIIKTEKPVVVEDFNKTQELGRFVLQRKDTCAGGIITRIK